MLSRAAFPRSCLSPLYQQLKYLSISPPLSVIHRAFEDKIDPGNKSCAELVLQKAWEHGVHFPDRIAFTDALNPQNKRTFKDVFVHSYSLAAFLDHELDFKKGDVACVFLHNSIDCASVYLGTTLAGGVITPASSHFTAEDLVKQVLDSGSSIVFCSEENLEIVLEAKKHAPKIRHVICVGPIVSEFTEQKCFAYKNVKKYQPLFSGCEIQTDQDLFCLPYSSGTTGLPKGVMLTHKNMASMLPNFTHACDMRIHACMIPPFVPTDQNTLLILPIYHIFGLGMMLKAVYAGESSVVMKKFDLKTMCERIQENKIRIITVAPPILLALAKNPIVEDYDLSSLEVVFSGAAPIGQDLCNEVFKKLPSLQKIVQGYGMTEVSVVASVASIESNTPIESVGLLIPGYELKVVDPETGEALGINKKGELWLRSDQVMKGYLNKPIESGNTVDPEGWLHTGDVGFIDDKGHIFIVDRLKELIKVKGYQVPPAELEDVLLSHPKVKDCAVVGIPCNLKGEVPRGYIVKKCDTLTEEEVHDYVNGKVAKYKQLAGGIEFVGDIPKSPSGKILRRLLR